jgi:hypothetical protein
MVAARANFTLTWLTERRRRPARMIHMPSPTTRREWAGETGTGRARSLSQAHDQLTCRAGPVRTAAITALIHNGRDSVARRPK